MKGHWSHFGDKKRNRKLNHNIGLRDNSNLYCQDLQYKGLDTSTKYLRTGLIFKEYQSYLTSQHVYKR